MKKRILAGVMTMLICILSMGMVSVSAESETFISVGSMNAKQGDTIVVPVSITNNPGIIGLGLNITYDESVFTYVKAEQGNALSGLALTKPGSSYTEGDLHFYWDSVTPDSTNGEILIITFKVSNSANYDAHPIFLRSEIIYDEKYEYVDIIASSGIIYVSETGEGTTPDEPIEPDIPEVDGATTITVGNVSARPGTIIQVPVSITNNLGICGLTLTIKYDASVFTYIDATRGEGLSNLDFTKPGKIQNGNISFVWDSDENDGTDGTIMYLNLKVADNVPYGDYIIDIEVMVAVYDDSKGYVEIYPYTEKGTVFVTENGGGLMFGDIDGDGNINSRDVVYLRRYISGGYGVNINEYFADLDNDGEINVIDILILRKHIVGGYGV